MRAKVTYLKDMKIKIVSGYVETTSHIDLQERSRSGEKYMKFLQFKNAPFVPIVSVAPDGQVAEREEADYIRLKSALSFLNLTPQEMILYLEAGKCYEDDEGIVQVQNPEYVLINSSLIEYAHTLWGCNSRRIQEKGFDLLDLVLPLSEKPVTEEELYLKDLIEQEILNAGRREVL